MSIGTKIRELREAKNMSLDEVAKLCNTTRQTIYKYENEIVTNIPYERVILLAKALNTTPSNLFGWTEGEKISLNEPELTEGEARLIELFRKVPTDRQQLVLQMIETALRNL
jgi:transcriptional regulator with XRE-family HTH domain